MSSFIVKGESSLKGTIIPQGNKNEALPILSAVILTNYKITLYNLPQIIDVSIMIDILKSLGVSITKINEHNYEFQASNIRFSDLDLNLLTKIRGSFTLVAPLLKRCKKVFFPKPGGDKIGRRRIDTHILALKALGTQVTITQKGYEFQCKKNFKGNNILLDEASVTATENAIMAACIANGKTIIYNAASEPHVQQLCRFINSIGGKISGIGSNILTIKGVKELYGGKHTLAADYLEVGSFIGMAAVTNSQLTIKQAGIPYLKMILNVFQRLGVQVNCEGEDIIIPKNQSLKISSDYHGAIPKIDDAPWPGFPADLISIMLVVATQCEGTILFFEKMYESRLFFVDKLISMGAKIVLCDPHRALTIGPSSLNGEVLSSPDIRAGVALLIAAMAAKGESIIHNINQIDRGYENIDKRLQKIGANITRIS